MFCGGQQKYYKNLQQMKINQNFIFMGKNSHKGFCQFKLPRKFFLIQARFFYLD